MNPKFLLYLFLFLLPFVGCATGITPIKSTLSPRDFRYSQLEPQKKEIPLVEPTPFPSSSQPLSALPASPDCVEIGALLPLSGKYAPYGESVLRAIILGLDLWKSENPATKVKLVLEDAGEDPESTASAMENLIKRPNVIGVVGPLLSKTSYRAAAIAEEKQIPLIVLSQNPGIAEVGDYIFHHGLTPDHQAERVAAWALNQGLRRFAILHGQDLYGKQLAEAFEKAIKKEGGELIAVRSYPSGETDFGEEIESLIGKERWQKHLAEIKSLKEKNPQTKTEEEETLAPLVGVEEKPRLVDFDALYIPDYPPAIGQIAPTLRYYDIEGITLLGSNGWNDPDLVRRGERFVENAVFVDGFFKQSRQAAVVRFCESFAAMTQDHQTPGVLEAYAYEAIKVIREGVESGEISSRDSLQRNLSARESFSGLFGEVTNSPTGEFFSPLVLLTVKGGKIQEVEN